MPPQHNCGFASTAATLLDATNSPLTVQTTGKATSQMLQNICTNTIVYCSQVDNHIKLKFSDAGVAHTEIFNFWAFHQSNLVATAENKKANAELACLVHSNPINNAMLYEIVAKVISCNTVVLPFLIGQIQVSHSATLDYDDFMQHYHKFD